MQAESMAAWTHDHVFLGVDHARNERRTRIVIALCCTIMVAEIVGGILFRSMALVADGLHMSTHAAALLIAAMALPLPVGARTIGVSPSGPASLAISQGSRARSCWQ
jgi:Co/Zn/Cd efflux system component